MQQIDPSFTNDTHSSDPHDTQFVTDLYHCLILALDVEHNNTADSSNVTQNPDLHTIELAQTTTSTVDVTDTTTEAVNNTKADASSKANLSE